MPEQLLPVREYAPLTEGVETVNGPFPEFDNVTVCDADDEPTVVVA